VLREPRPGEAEEIEDEVEAGGHVAGGPAGALGIAPGLDTASPPRAEG
jgi:hypothetical protein